MFSTFLYHYTSTETMLSVQSLPPHYEINRVILDNHSQIEVSNVILQLDYLCDTDRTLNYIGSTYAA